jgi:hypothetical protein
MFEREDHVVTWTKAKGMARLFGLMRRTGGCSGAYLQTGVRMNRTTRARSLDLSSSFLAVRRHCHRSIGESIATRTSIAVIVAVRVLSAIPALAQQVETTSSLASDPVQAGIVPQLEALERSYRTGNLTEARKLATALLKEAAESLKRAEKDPKAFDFTSNVIVVVWAGKDGTGPVVLRRLTIPEPSSHPYSLDLPGLRSDAPPLLYEVLLAPDPRARLVSQYTFTREENPIVAQIPTVAERLMGPIFSLLATVGGPVPTTRAAADVAEEAPIFATSSRVVVPFQRASIKVKSVAQIPVTLAEWNREVDHLEEVLRFDVAPRSPWGKGYAGRLAAAAKDVADKPECKTDDAKPDACLRLFGDAFERAFQDCVVHCVPGATPGTDDLAALDAVDRKFREFVAAGGPVRVERALEIKNRPLTHLSLGVGTAVVVNGSVDGDRAKVNDDGNLVADPLSRLLTMIMLNWSPWGYDEDARSPQKAERWRFFAAGIVTPDPGIAVGGSMLVVRGLAITGGYGLVFTHGLNAGDELGKPPKNPNDPLDFAKAKVWFAGVSYNFK